MSAQDSPTWTQRGSAFSRRVGLAGQDLRISDADRAEAADLLAKHYAEGRLDEAEFDKRMNQAMRAKTRSDLSGLFADLPEIAESGPARSQPQERPQHRVLLLVLVIAVAIVAGRALMAVFLPWWLIVILLVFLLWHYGPARHRRR
jgi:hypothetical protein